MENQKARAWTTIENQIDIVFEVQCKLHEMGYIGEYDQHYYVGY